MRHANLVLFFGAGRQGDGTPFLVEELKTWPAVRSRACCARTGLGMGHEGIAGGRRPRTTYLHGLGQIIHRD